MKEKRPKQDDMYKAAFNKYIGDKVMIDVPGEGQEGATFRCPVGDLDGAKFGTYHWNLLMDTCCSTSWNMMMVPMIANLPMLFIITYIHR